MGYCCKTTRVLKGCLDTDWINNWDEKFTAQVAKDMVLVGMYSIHENHYDDRRFKLHYCKAPSTPKPKPTGPKKSTDKGEKFCRRYKAWCSQIVNGGRWAAYMKKNCGESCKKFTSGTNDKGDKVSFEPNDNDLLQLEADHGKPPFKSERLFESNCVKVTDSLESCPLKTSNVNEHSKCDSESKNQTSDDSSLIKAKANSPVALIEHTEKTRDVQSSFVPENNVWAALRKIRES